MELWTVGYGAWPAKTRAVRLVEALTRRGVTRVVDTRLCPCSSTPEAARPYGPKSWTLQAGDAGIAALLRSAGLAYEWIVELGNPQRRDPAMAVLRAHLADPEGGWPVHRGLGRLAGRVRTPGQVVALLCACADARACHRTVLAHALAERHFGGALTVRECVEGRQSPNA